MPTPFRPLKGFGHLIINADEVFDCAPEADFREILEDIRELCFAA